jgi:LmbE family N-acetylglucosaminyl deacetylase
METNKREKPQQQNETPTPDEAVTPRRLLGVWAHPDDEAYLSAGLMDQVVASGGSVTIVTMTDGEHGFPDSDPRPVDVRSAQRRGELREAMATIGVRDIRFLGIEDGQLATVPQDLLAARVASVMRHVKPDLVVTFGPDGITGHDDHIANSSIATAAWKMAGTGELWYAAKTESWLSKWRKQHDQFGLWMTEEPTGVPNEMAKHVIDLAGAKLDAKRAVLGAHRSQTQMVVELFGEAAYREWICQETFRAPTAQELLAADKTLELQR